MNIYVGNLAYQATEGDLRNAFGAFGEVTSAAVITDKASGQSKGFGFVEMADDESARRAIAAIDGSPIKGRPVKVNEARPREDRRDDRGPSRPRSGGGGGGRDRW